ncbi:hypothetical protein MLIT_33620 [Mycolicibacterium litorale]|uniref:Uncharacterized protein n=1 Tax=Mycolicibacterium litorale TaxID=758802 RepID=A0AAD1IL77_9MYCO|nr:hypothetical protein MLIT_33620 [Mycolicibacterium litorale]
MYVPYPPIEYPAITVRFGSAPSCSTTRANTSHTSSSPSSKYQHAGPRAKGVTTIEFRPSHTSCSSFGSNAAYWFCPSASECSIRVSGSFRPGAYVAGRHTE